MKALIQDIFNVLTGNSTQENNNDVFARIEKIVMEAKK
jgi:hypothetical protein